MDPPNRYITSEYVVLHVRRPISARRRDRAGATYIAKHDLNCRHSTWRKAVYLTMVPRQKAPLDTTLHVRDLQSDRLSRADGFLVLDRPQDLSFASSLDSRDLHRVALTSKPSSGRLQRIARRGKPIQLMSSRRIALTPSSGGIRLDSDLIPRLIRLTESVTACGNGFEIDRH